jgi:hypothetical protein
MDDNNHDDEGSWTLLLVSLAFIGIIIICLSLGATEHTYQP